MPAALRLDDIDADLVERYRHARAAVGRQTGRSTEMAARTFCARLARGGGWAALTPAQQRNAVAKARAFASWLMITAQLRVDADLLSRLDLRLGTTARVFRAEDYHWFKQTCGRLALRENDIALQWNTLIKITALSGVGPSSVGDEQFCVARQAILDVYHDRGLPNSGRNMASVFHRLQLTLFHAGRLDSLHRPAAQPPVSTTGWTGVAPGFADTACRTSNR